MRNLYCFLITVFLFLTPLNGTSQPIIHEFYVDDIKLDGNTVSTTSGSLVLAPSSDLVLGSHTGFIKAASGVVSAQAMIDLLSDTSGTLSIERGGTNSTTALTNDKVMVSSAGAIVESSSIDTTELGFLDGVTSLIQGQLDALSTSVSGKVGLTGDETIAGVKTFSSAAVFDLGFTSNNTSTFTAPINASHTTVAGQFQVTGSSPSRPCPRATQAEIDAYATPGDGDCFYNTDTKRNNTYDASAGKWVESGTGGGGAAGVELLEDGSFEKGTTSEIDCDGPSPVIDETVVEQGINNKKSLKVTAEVSLPGISIDDCVVNKTVNSEWTTSTPMIKYLKYKIPKTNVYDYKFVSTADGSDQTYTDGTVIEVPMAKTGKWEEVRLPTVSGASSNGYRIVYESDSSTIQENFWLDQMELRTQNSSDIQSINDVDTDWVPCTATGSWTGTYSAMCKRDGDTLFVEGVIELTATPTGTLTTTVPYGETIDAGKLVSDTLQAMNWGESSAFNGVQLFPVRSNYSSPTTITFRAYNTSNIFAQHQDVNPTVPFTWASGDKMFFKYAVPIQGWETGRTNVTQQRKELTAETANEFKGYVNGSNVSPNVFDVMSCSCASGAISCTYTETFTEAPIVEIDANIDEVDSAGIFARVETMSTTGFTAVTGYSNPTGTSATDAVGVSCYPFTYTISKKGDDFNKSINVDGYFNSSQINFNDTVYATYTSYTDQSVGTSNTVIKYESKIKSSGDDYNTSSGTYTFPVSGLYAIDAQAILAASPSTTTCVMTFDFSTLTDRLWRELYPSSSYGTCRQSTIVYASKGETMTVKLRTSSATTTSLDNREMILSIARIR